jgi:hypothetical protein
MARQHFEAVQCVHIGIVKPISEASCYSGLLPGMIAEHVVGDQIRVFILVAHVQGDSWLCHSGARQSREFRTEDLVPQEVSFEAVSTQGPAKKRRVPKKQWRPGGHAGEKEFAELVARGAWVAEEMRARLEDRAVDPEQCRQMFDASPQVLPHGMRSRVAFLWRWKERPTDEIARPQWQHHISITNMYDLLDHGRSVPLPPSFAAAHLLQQLEEAALPDQSRLDTRQPSCGCTYLGVPKEDTSRPWAAPACNFQKDPAQFPADTIGEDVSLSQSSVW